MNTALRSAFQSELAAAAKAAASVDTEVAMMHLSRAHIISQHYTIQHVRVHWLMLEIGVMRRDWHEVAGQLSRIVAASLFSRIWVPIGNTGRANVSALKPMPVPDDIRDLFLQSGVRKIFKSRQSLGVRHHVSQRVLPLDGVLAADLDAKRRWVIGHYGRDPERSYSTVEAKLLLLETIINSGWVKPTETVKLQALGVAFGDALAQQLGLTWVAIDDEYGCDAALIIENTSVKVFPLTSLSKRLEAGETVDVRKLFAEACATIRHVATDAKQ